MTRLRQHLGKLKFVTVLGKALVPLDHKLLRVTRGKVGVGSALGLRTMLLTTIGRRSGRRREVALQYIEWKNGFVVIGSNWGGERHPAWSANLLAHPEATAVAAGRTIAVRARLLAGTEREEAWEAVVARWPGYANYAQTAGNRRIRLFLLQPSPMNSLV